MFKPNPQKAAQRAVRKADKAVTIGLALRAVVGHVTLTRGEVIAWYLMEPFNPSFRGHEEVEATIHAGATSLSRLGSVRTYWRITSRPLAVREWAERTYNDAVAHGQPLPCFPDFLEREQLRLQQCNYSTKHAFIGVRVAETRRHPLDPRREVAALEGRLAEIEDCLSSDGLDALPATPEQMELLLRRSVALGMPSPRLDTVAAGDYELADLPQLDQLASVTATPFGKTAVVKYVTEDGEELTRYVAVLTMGRVGTMNIPQDGKGGYMHRTDRLPFPCEWMGTVDQLDQEPVGNSLRHQMDVIRDQYAHYVDEHRIEPPETLRRQHAQALAAEHELEGGLGGEATRTQGWFRLAVWSDSEQETLRRVAAVRKLYGRDIEWWHSGGQVALVREFTPGQPLANTAARRRFVLPSVLAALPAATAQLGHDHGAVIGGTSGTSQSAVSINLWLDMEQRDRSGLMLNCGGLGSGKSTMNGALVYRTVVSGVQWSVLDPSGRMGTLCELPELRDHARYYDLLRGRDGELSMYRVVADPDREHYDDGHKAQQDYEEDTRDAAATRQVLARDVLTSWLPKALRDDKRTASVMGRITREIPARADTSPFELLSYLEQVADAKAQKDLTREHRIIARDIWNELSALARSHRGRLIFGDTQAPPERHLLEVYSLAGMNLPSREALAAGEESTDARMALGLFTLAAWKVNSRTYQADPNQRKGLLIEEGHLLAQIPSGNSLMAKTAVDTRKHNLRAIISSQNITHFDLAELANLTGLVAVGKTTDASPGGAGEAALTLLGRPHEQRYLATLAALSPGSNARRDGRSTKPAPKYREFIFAMKDEQGAATAVERCVIDLYAHPHVLDALGTTPGSEKQSEPLPGGPAGTVTAAPLRQNEEVA